MVRRMESLVAFGDNASSGVHERIEACVFIEERGGEQFKPD